MKNIIIVVLFTLSTFCLAQTININSTVFSTNGEKTFPIWVEAGTTIQPNSPIKSISVKEFNVIPNSNGNDLVFNKTILVYSDSVSTVPSGKSWKLESVQNELQIGDEYAGGIVFYLDGNGGGKIFAPYSLARKSSNSARIYCEELNYDGYSDWVLPSSEDLWSFWINHHKYEFIRTVEVWVSDESHYTYDDSSFNLSSGQITGENRSNHLMVIPIRQF